MTSKQAFSKLTKKRKLKQKKFEKWKRQQDFTNHYEIETEFSNDLRILGRKKIEKNTVKSIQPTELRKDLL